MIPTEQNDRLLELMYAGKPQGCRHPYLWTNNSRTQDGKRSKWYKCPNCGVTGYALENAEPSPAVGDGHQMTLGEMVRLAHTRWPGCCIAMYEDFVCLWLLEQGDKEGFRGWHQGNDGNLAAAILAAVDGERK